MGNLPHKPLPKLRTFQLDQAHARGEAPLPVATRDDSHKMAAPAAPKIIVTTTKATLEETKKEVPVQSKVATPIAPPAFHELKKNATKHIDHIVAESSEPAVTQKVVTVRKKSSTPPPRSFSSEATIISSGRKNEFRFFPALIASFKGWLAALQNTNSSPSYTVGTIDKRKELIQKATTRSGANFTTDNSSLKDELTKNREEIPHDLTVSWSPKTEALFPLLEEPDRLAALPPKSPVVVSYKRKSIPAPQLIEPTPQPNSAQKRIFIPPQTSVKTAWESDLSAEPDSPYAASIHVPPAPPKVTPVITAPVIAPPVFKVPEPVQFVTPTSIAPTVTPPPPPLSTPIATTPVLITPPTPVVPVSFTKPGTSIPNKPNPKTSYLNRGLRQLFRFDTTIATVVLVGSLVSFVMMFLIVKTLVGMVVPSSGTDKTTVSLAVPLTPKGNVIDIAVSTQSFTALKSALSSQARPAAGVTEFRIVEASGQVLSGNRLWQTLGLSPNSNLSGSVTEGHVGYSNGEDMLVLKVTDAVTVFGALLAWEKNMPEEFSPLFNQDISAVTSVTDKTVENSDVRILMNDSEIILVYGFIDKNTVVITESLEAYQATMGIE